MKENTKLYNINLTLIPAKNFVTLIIIVILISGLTSYLCTAFLFPRSLEVQDSQDKTIEMRYIYVYYNVTKKISWITVEFTEATDTMLFMVIRSDVTATNGTPIPKVSLGERKNKEWTFYNISDVFDWEGVYFNSIRYYELVWKCITYWKGVYILFNPDEGFGITGSIIITPT